MTEEQSRNIEFELAELICIEHTLAPSQAVAGSAESGVLGPGKDTCLKIGTAILEALSNQQPIAISFTEDELWLLRERVSIYTSQGAAADLGLIIKSKFYQALLSIGNKRAAEAVLEDAAMVGKDSEGEGLSREEVDDGIRRWNEADGRWPNAGPRTWNPHRPGDNPEDKTRPKTSPKPR